ELAEVPDRLIEDAGDVLGAARVGGQRQHLGARLLADLLRGLLDPLLVAGEDGDPCALPGELEGDGLAQSLACRGDECHSAGESEIHAAPPPHGAAPCRAGPHVPRMMRAQCSMMIAAGYSPRRGIIPAWLRSQPRVVAGAAGLGLGCESR